nr:HlyD family efflux transporter periplasmic adaptor subunit [Salinisphaera sp. G21_0]
MFIPVRLSVLAPAEVVADQPELVVAPLTGVIKEVLVTPHEQVTPGQPLIRFEDTDLRNRLLLVEEELLVSDAQLLKVRQQSFLDGRSAEQIAELQARVNLKKAELSYSRELLERSTVSARQPGIAVFRDKSDWTGKPVQQGERIFYIADPGLVELQIFLPVRDAIALTPGTDVKLFLDTLPLEPLVATLTYASYDAEVTPEGILAYRLKASLHTNESGSEELPRIGLQGTAKLYGEYAPLAMYLLRRPLAYLRQWIGF